MYVSIITGTSEILRYTLMYTVENEHPSNDGIRTASQSQ